LVWKYMHDITLHFTYSPNIKASQPSAEKLKLNNYACMENFKLNQ